MKRRLTSLMLLTMLLVALGTQVAFANLTGAIFTTLPDGSRVNANIYDSKLKVYLDGGPGNNAPAQAASLPDGWYVFQVTDPSGKVLLSQDEVICRQFQVVGGLIADVRATEADGTTKAGKTYQAHVMGDDVDHAAKTVRLMPYLDTPNKGGVYKVWAMRYEDFVAKNGVNALYKVDLTPGKQFHGFVPSMSKTDNFKVKGAPEQRLIVKKFCDSNANGEWDSGEPEITQPAGWPLKIVEPTGVTHDPIYTQVNMISQMTGLWSIWEYAHPVGDPRPWFQTHLSVDGAKQSPILGAVLVNYGLTDGETHTVIFGNVPLGSIVAHKFNDEDCSKSQGTDEPDVSDYGFTLKCISGRDAGKSWTGKTGADGTFTFDNLFPGRYELAEEKRADWLPTTETTQVVDLVTCSPVAETVVVTKHFGNVRPVNVDVFKFIDKNGNGTFDEGESVGTDWNFELSGTNKLGDKVGPLAGKTGADGRCSWENLYPGDYAVTEKIPADTKWVVSALYYRVNGGDPVKETPGCTLPIPAGAGETWDVAYGNTQPGCISAYKYWDKLGDGVKDETDPVVPNWPMTLKGTDALGRPVERTEKTNASGVAVFDNLWPGDYKVYEDLGDPDVWYPTSASESASITIEMGGTGSAEFLNCKYGDLTVFKFEDLNGDGDVDEGEPTVADFEIRITPGSEDAESETKKTSEDGKVVFARLKPGSYTVEEIIPSGSAWKQTALYYRSSGGVDFTKATGTSVTVPIASGDHAGARFLNCRPGTIPVEKFYDADGDGVKDPSEQWIEGFKIVLTGTENFDGDADGSLAVKKTAFTDENGKAEFTGLWPGTYAVEEIMPPAGGWYATTVTKFTGIALCSGETECTRQFGNVYYEEADFGTKGWWHNNNGNPLIDSSDIAYLNGLDPFDDPTEYWDMPFANREEIGEFVVAAVSVSPHRMQLAQQLTAFILNVRHYTDGADTELMLPGNEPEVAQDLIDGAISAWQAGDVAECSSWIARLDAYNNCNAVLMVSAVPGPIVY